MFTGIAEKQVGAVSHSDDAGIQGLTIVNIDNDGDAGYSDICAGCTDVLPTLTNALR